MVGCEHDLGLSVSIQSIRINVPGHTKLSPLSFMILGERPAGSACWKMSICPALAAAKNLEAMSMTSGGIEERGWAIVLFIPELMSL